MSDNPPDEVALGDLPQPEFDGTVPTDSLHVDGENPNEQDEETFGLLCDRMRDNGWLGGPIVTDTDGLIADGEHRWRAAQEIGLGEVPVRQYAIDDATRRLWRQELNKIAGEHDPKRDALEYDELLAAGKTEEVEALTDAAGEDLDDLLDRITDDDTVPAQYEYDPDHEVFFEDCVDGMRERLPAGSVDCVITDPPYGIDFQSNHRSGASTFDRLDADEDVEAAVSLYRDVIAEVERVLRDGGHFYTFTRWDVYPHFYAAIADVFEVKNCIVWRKHNWGMGDLEGAYAPAHEFAIFATAGSGDPLRDGRPPDVVEHGQPHTADYEHPTQKPVDLIADLLTNSTDEGDTVLDPFLGSGTTAVAALERQRDVVGFEIDEENYRDVIERRVAEAERVRDASVNAGSA